MRNMIAITSDWARKTRPIYIIDPEVGEMIHVVRLGRIKWAREMGIELYVDRGDYQISPDEWRLLIAPSKPTAVILNLKNMEEQYEPYLCSWWFLGEPRLMKKFERLEGAVELMREKLLDKKLGWMPWRGAMGGGYGGFPDNNHVLICTYREARMYNLKTGELVAREENAYALKALFETHILGRTGKLEALAVSRVKLPPTPFIITGTLITKYRAYGWLSMPKLSSEMDVRAYPGDPRRIMCTLRRVSSRDFFTLPYDYINNIVPEWHGIEEDGWPLPNRYLGRSVVREYRSRIEDMVCGRIVKVEYISPSISGFGVDPRGGFVVVSYSMRVEFMKGDKRDFTWSFFVVWFDLRSGHVLHVWFPEDDDSRDPLGAYVLPSGHTIIYCTGREVFVFDSSFRLVRWLRYLSAEEDRRLRAEFNRVAGVHDFYWGDPCVSPDLRRVVIPFYQSTEEFEKSGILKDGLSWEFLDDSRYYALSERARRDFRTLYLAFYNWDWELEGFVKFLDPEERAIIHPEAPFWF